MLGKHKGHEENLDEKNKDKNQDASNENKQDDINQCNCSEDCKCGEDCKSNDECKCDDECRCNKDESEKQSCGQCHCHNNSQNNQDENENLPDDEKLRGKDLAGEYLNMARQIQADFENFRRHAVEDIKKARTEGQESVIEVFLPCLDTFREAKKSIIDENVLKGVQMIEDKIHNALKSIGVEKIASIGEKFNPHLHHVIAVSKDSEKDNDIILDEYQAGYKFNDKVIRYAMVLVNKKED